MGTERFNQCSLAHQHNARSHFQAGYFFRVHDTPNDLRECLMEMYHSYILHEYDCLPDDFRRVAEGMIMFFNFLKFAAEEFNALNGIDTGKVGEE